MLRSRRWSFGKICTVGIAWALLVGPWPAPDLALTTSPPYRETLRRLDRSSVSRSFGRLRAGVAEVDITPDRPVPVAGFLDQIWEPSTGINSQCFARALTVECGSTSVTILTADLLLIDAQLTQQILNRTALPRDQVYVTASHTHSGPGGWGNHPLERLVAGTFDAEETNDLADRLAQVILLSRGNLQPVDVAFVQTDVFGMQENRISRGSPTNDRLSAWVFRTASNPGNVPTTLATLASFGAHATVGHTKPSRIGGDYPAAFAAALRRQARAGVVLFAAGTVGDAAPVRPKAINQQQSVQAYGEQLAEQLAGLLESAEFLRESPLANLGLVVDLPPVQVPMRLGSLRFSPAAVWWVGRPRTYLHTVQLGPAILAGFPGDLAGQLAARLEGPTPVVATSFNGDYKGYLVSRDTFWNRPGYETRVLNFFGPGLGEFLVDMAQESLVKIKASQL